MFDLTSVTGHGNLAGSLFFAADLIGLICIIVGALAALKRKDVYPFLVGAAICVGAFCADATAHAGFHTRHIDPGLVKQ